MGGAGPDGATPCAIGVEKDPTYLIWHPVGNSRIGAITARMEGA
jgi:hypothetical protein